MQVAHISELYRIVAIRYVKSNEVFSLVSDGGSSSGTVSTVHCYQKHLFQML